MAPTASSLKSAWRNRTTLKSENQRLDGRGNAQRRPLISAGSAVLLAGLVITACGGSQNWYQAGKTFGAQAERAQGNFRFTAFTPGMWCGMLTGSGFTTTTGFHEPGRRSTTLGKVPTNLPPAADSEATRRWLNGCATGILVANPHATPPRLGSQAARNWFITGKDFAITAENTSGIDVTYDGVTATTASAWCSDLLFLPQPEQLKALLLAHAPGAGAEAVEWTKGCESEKP
jgi:hypothetical protein